MSTEKEKLERFEKAVYDEVDIQIQDILAQAESSRSELLEKANDVSLYEAYDRIKDEIKKISSKYVRLVSKAELDSKREVLVQREKLANQVIDDVKKSLISFTQTDEYKKYLIDLIKDEIENSKDISEMIFYVSNNDLKLSDEINKALSKEIYLQPKENIKIGGLCVGYKNDNILLDKTLDSALEEERCDFNNSCCLRLN